MHKRPFRLHMGASEQSLFAKRLAMILRSGVPLLSALFMLENGSNSKSGAYIVQRLQSDIAAGRLLSSTLGSFGSVFSPLTISIVRIGETSGTLRQNLEYLAEELKKRQAIKKKVMSALAYPLLILCATLGISTALTTYIFPKILPIFKGFKQELPLSTRILIAVSDFLMHDGLLFVIGVAIAVFGAALMMRIRRVRFMRDKLLLRILIFGALARAYNLANISRTMSLLLQTNTGIVRSFEIVSDSIGNLAYRETLHEMAQCAARGGRITDVMHACALFPPLYGQMIRAGEETGNLSESFGYLSEMYEEEINDLSRNLTTLLEPVLMLVMGAMVGFIAISIIAPIYGITQNLTPH